MNIFTFVGTTLGQASGVITRTLSAVENVAEMAEETTGAMLEEQRAESASRLEDLRVRLKSIKS